MMASFFSEEDKYRNGSLKMSTSDLIHEKLKNGDLSKF